MMSQGRAQRRGREAASQSGSHRALLLRLLRWNVPRFLFCGGTVLATIGMAGVVGLLRSLSRAALFNPPYWINWFHLSFGAAVLAIAMYGSRRFHLGLAFFAAIAGTILGAAGIVAALTAVAHHAMAQWSDPVAHLAVAALAIWALRNSGRERKPA